MPGGGCVLSTSSDTASGNAGSVADTTLRVSPPSRTMKSAGVRSVTGQRRGGDEDDGHGRECGCKQDARGHAKVYVCRMDGLAGGIQLIFREGDPHRGPDPVRSEPANRVRAGRQQR